MAPLGQAPISFGAIGADTTMGKISADDVRKVAHLARLDLAEATIATYTTQLERILDYVAHLEQVDTEGVPPTTRAVEVVNVTRDDAVNPTPVREDLLDLAPEREGDFVRVPKILAD
jgi:aspartyl-tRNA(Asn)/glutamyl-tRNA(Gln) amidotransferase subunit C